MVTEAVRSAEVTACKTNLKNIYNGLMLYKGKYNSIPSQGGVRFFADLIARGAIENTKANAERLTCPGVEKASLAIRDIPWDQWWPALETINGSSSAYAGRDMKNQPLRQFPGSGREPLVADDNDGGMNHHTTTNVLYADGSVQTFELVDEQNKGTLTKDET